jgi:S-adenosyl methyltransferase
MAAVAPLLPAAQVAEITAGYMPAVPSGSWLVLSADHVPDDPLRASLALVYGADLLYDHGPAEVAAFLSMLDVIGPGIAEARRWLSGIGGVAADEPACVLCAAGIKLP